MNIENSDKSDGAELDFYRNRKDSGEGGSSDNSNKLLDKFKRTNNNQYDKSKYGGMGQEPEYN
jgi:hypothetical protein